MELDATSDTHTKSFVNGICCLHYFAFIFILLVAVGVVHTTRTTQHIQIDMPTLRRCMPFRKLINIENSDRH